MQVEIGASFCLLKHSSLYILRILFSQGMVDGSASKPALRQDMRLSTDWSTLRTQKRLYHRVIV